MPKAKQVRHPARFHDDVLDIACQVIDEHYGQRPISILDPFAGTGRVHELITACRKTTGVEIEPEWANEHARTRIGDATKLPSWWTRQFDVVVTSPCYGNRMADHHEAADACSECLNGEGLTGRVAAAAVLGCSKCGGTGLSPRRSYRHDLGRMPSEGSAATMQWGDEYRDLHERAWHEVHRVLKPGGLFILNSGDHIRGGQRQRVSDWHRRTIEAMGFTRLETWSVELPGMRRGANREARVGYEYIYVFQR